MTCPTGVILGPGRRRAGAPPLARGIAPIIPNPVAFAEDKGRADMPASSEASSPKIEKRVVRVPSGHKVDVTIDSAYLREAVAVEAIR